MQLPYFKKQLSLVPYMGKLSVGSTPNIALEIDDPDQLVYNILKLCTGSNTYDDIYVELKNNCRYYNLSKEDVVNIIDTIASYPHILEDYNNTLNSDFSNAEIERHSRTMNFLSNFDSSGDHKVNYMKALTNSNVLIIGLGGVGSSLVLSLSALGVKHIVGIDFDKVELSNLNRQLLYSETDIGKLKSEAATKIINNFDKSIDFKTYQLQISSSREVEELILENNIDFVFCAADHPPIRIYKWVNTACLNTKTPWICTDPQKLE